MALAARRTILSRSFSLVGQMISLLSFAMWTFWGLLAREHVQTLMLNNLGLMVDTSHRPVWARVQYRTYFESETDTKQHGDEFSTVPPFDRLDNDLLVDCAVSGHKRIQVVEALRDWHDKNQDFL